MALTWVTGTDIQKDHRAGRSRIRGFAVSTAATDMPAPTPGNAVYWPDYGGTPDSGATGRVFIRGQIDENLFPGLYFYVLDYEGALGRT